MPDHDRLARLLGRPECEPLLRRLRQRLERGHPLTGTIILHHLGAGQREAISLLLGRPPGQTGEQFVSVRLDELEARLKEARVCESLRQAVELLTGPVDNTVARHAKREARWAAVFDQAPDILRRPRLAVCLTRWRTSGSLKRLARGSPVAAENLLARAARIAALLPTDGRTLAQLAAETLGNAHALDPGEPTTTLVLQLAAALAEIELASDAEGRRDVWAAVGVICDELSAPALVLNLPATGESRTAELLRLARGEPLHLSLRLLVRHPLSNDKGLAGRNVFVCENATVVALAAARLGRECVPLVSVQGQYATPSRVLLRQLCTAGARLHYHGDFDAGGLAIARRVIGEFSARPWRMSAADYLAAPKGERLNTAPGLTPWDYALAGAMEQHRRVVHEEAVFETLAADLVDGAYGVS